MPKYLPSTTYRFQFNEHFTFRDFRQHLEYFQRLGAGCIYASPIFKAVPGSNHGYDVTDAHVLNPEIGNLREFLEIQKILRQNNTGWLQDIVPNHMAFHPGNHWLMDVLQKGRSSAFAGYFDIDWDHPGFNDKVMVPVLGKSLEACLQDDEIRLVYEQGQFKLAYYNLHLPLSSLSVKELDIDQKAPHQACSEINADKNLLTGLMNKQHYILSHWQETDHRLNFRRFFTINGLISLSIEKNEVFEEYHRFILEQVKKGNFSGLRIDHIDGLMSPDAYLEKLRSSAGDSVYIVAEKILQENEAVKSTWPIEGTTGYDFLAMVNNLFFNAKSVPALQKLWPVVHESDTDPATFAYNCKKKILADHFRGDLDNLYRVMETKGLLVFFDNETTSGIKEAMGEFLICFPVYKLYAVDLPLSGNDALTVKNTIREAIHRNPSLKKPLLLMGNLFLEPDNRLQEERMYFFQKLMQYSGPLMAKGIEDTAMYSWAEFIAHNEVGDSITAKGFSVDEFHKIMAARRKNLPASMNATATHDTKRGEDSRARLNSISDMPAEWTKFIKQSMTRNRAIKEELKGILVPDMNEEYFIYQLLAGVLPMDGIVTDELRDRIAAYIQKALREAKVHSNWVEPDEAYEKAVIMFVNKILAKNSAFLTLFMPFFKRISIAGAVNSFSQVVLKFMCPGIPDVYQGTELWDFSLVDPDNRRSVDFNLRNRMLSGLQEMRKNDPARFINTILRNVNDGRLKLWITHCLMQERFAKPEDFVYAEYQPLEVSGLHKENLLAFCRRYNNTWYMVLVPLHTANVGKPNGEINWGNTAVELSGEAPEKWHSLWDGTPFVRSGKVPAGAVLQKNIPYVLKAEKEPVNRACGVLLHITSLPGKHGAGGLGEEAFHFVDFLKVSGHRYWQILPFSPVGNTWSPYSAPSAFAGNISLIDLQALNETYGLQYRFPNIRESSTAQHGHRQKISNTLINLAFEEFCRNNRYGHIKKAFSRYCESNAIWLDDYALFLLLKEKNKNLAWNRWPVELKERDAKVLMKVQQENNRALERIKFAQFVFHEQFLSLRQYANHSGVKIIGDIPIYINYDSADVWSHPELFRLDVKGNMITVAGVPPDYFSKTGQRWNMPVYDWKRMKQQRFRWWIERVRKNLEYCDMLRFDHFRGFSAFWEVPAAGKTAIKGKWTKGPGNHFFDMLKKEFPDMPFIAEDLGEIDEPVYQLRDAYHLPGMRVLQFAFGGKISESIHIPFHHAVNSIVYTGTHDNNTLLGWFKQDANALSRKNLNRYFGTKVNRQNVIPLIIQATYASVAKISIVPMQDLLALDSSARFNTPSKASGNWLWKLRSVDLNNELCTRLNNWATIYGRL